MSGDRELDVVVFGATGFAGRLVAGYLAGHAPGGVRIGLAGRSAQRLADVRARLGEAASAWPLLPILSGSESRQPRGWQHADLPDLGAGRARKCGSICIRDRRRRSLL